MNDDKLKNFICIYSKIDEQQSIQSLTKAKIKITAKNKYITGISVDRYITLRADRVIAIFDDYHTAQEALIEANFLLAQQENIKFDLPEYISETANHSFDICFTGFTKLEKIGLIKKATDMGLSVKKSVTAYLDILCYGDKAGPNKIARAKKIGASLIDKNQFHNFISTGELS